MVKGQAVELNYNGVEPLDETEPNGNTIMNFDSCVVDSNGHCKTMHKSMNDLILNINGKKIYIYINDDMLRIASSGFFTENESVLFSVNEKETNTTTLVIDVK